MPANKLKRSAVLRYATKLSSIELALESKWESQPTPLAVIGKPLPNKKNKKLFPSSTVIPPQWIKKLMFCNATSVVQPSQLDPPESPKVLKDSNTIFSFYQRSSHAP